ncbi:MAG: hypothetical protein AB1633_05985 [Elusimicrobiota bacterium]
MERFVDYLKGSEDIKEIPRSQRYINRPSLCNLFGNEILKDKYKRGKKVLEGVEEYGYIQR